MVFKPTFATQIYFLSIQPGFYGENLGLCVKSITVVFL